MVPQRHPFLLAVQPPHVSMQSFMAATPCVLRFPRLSHAWLLTIPVPLICCSPSRLAQPTAVPYSAIPPFSFPCLAPLVPALPACEPYPHRCRSTPARAPRSALDYCCAPCPTRLHRWAMVAITTSIACHGVRPHRCHAIFPFPALDRCPTVPARAAPTVILSPHEHAWAWVAAHQATSPRFSSHRRPSPSSLSCRPGLLPHLRLGYRCHHELYLLEPLSYSTRCVMPTGYLDICATPSSCPAHVAVARPNASTCRAATTHAHPRTAIAPHVILPSSPGRRCSCQRACLLGSRRYATVGLLGSCRGQAVVARVLVQLPGGPLVVVVPS